MIKRILVALSGTPYTTVAVRYALDLARRHDAAVTGVTVVDPAALANVGPVPVGAGAAAAGLAEFRHMVTEERVEQTIAEFEAACRDAGLAGEVDRETGDPLDRLADLWRYHDLTIFGLRGLFEYGVVHNPDDHLIRLIREGIRPLIAAPAEHRPVRHALIAYNGSVTSAKTMKQFIQMNPWPEARLSLVNFTDKTAEGEALLADAAAYCAAHGREATPHVVDAHARDALLEFATGQQVDLVVMGSTARSRLTSHVLGDTALRAIRRADIPLFLSR